MQWNKMLKHLRENYEIYDPIYQLNDKEATEVLDSYEYQPFHVMVETILRKYDFSPEIRKAFEPAMKRSKRRHFRGQKSSFSVHANKRFVKVIIVFVVLIVTTTFFMLHPAGRSLFCPPLSTQFFDEAKLNPFSG